MFLTNKQPSRLIIKIRHEQKTMYAAISNLTDIFINYFVLMLFKYFTFNNIYRL